MCCPLLHNRCPSVCRLEHMNAGVAVLDLRFEVVVAPKASGQTDSLGIA